MSIEKVLLKGFLWALLFALALGGRPWQFPEGGKYWLEITYGSPQ